MQRKATGHPIGVTLCLKWMLAPSPSLLAKLFWRLLAEHRVMAMQELAGEMDAITAMKEKGVAPRRVIPRSKPSCAPKTTTKQVRGHRRWRRRRRR